MFDGFCAILTCAFVTKVPAVRETPFVWPGPLGWQALFGRPIPHGKAAAEVSMSAFYRTLDLEGFPTWVALWT